MSTPVCFGGQPIDLLDFYLTSRSLREKELVDLKNDFASSLKGEL